MDTPSPGRVYNRMSAHNIAEAGANLPDLIDRAIAGEAVIITRDGRPVLRRGANEDAGPFISKMRDEEWDR